MNAMKCQNMYGVFVSWNGIYREKIVIPTECKRPEIE